MRDERLRKTELLLRDAAGWEPERSAPERLAQRALALAVQPEPRRSRPSGLALLLALLGGGGAVSAALSGTLLLVGAPSQPVDLAPMPKASLPQVAGRTAPQPELAVERARPTLAAHTRVRPRLTRRTARRRHAGMRLTARVAASRQSLPPAIWHTEEVERREEGVIAPGVLVESDPSTGSVYLSPTLVDISLSGSSACTPLEETAPPLEPEPAGGPSEPERPEGERE